MSAVPWVAVISPCALTTIVAARRPAEAKALPESNESVKTIRALEAQIQSAKETP